MFIKTQFLKNMEDRVNEGDLKCQKIKIKL